MIEKPKSRMYEVEGKTVRTWNVFKGCKYDCNYCVQREQAKRQKHRCEKCYNYEPHMHLERLGEKFKSGEVVFVAAAGDISFANFYEFSDILTAIKKFWETTFLLQSKNPAYFHSWDGHLPFNVVLGTTIETNEYPRMFVSEAPYPIFRKHALHQIEHSRKYLTFEPMLNFDLDILIEWAKEIAPELVYVGYLNPLWKAKKLRLPEPLLENTKELCKELAKFTEVRLKTIRKAYYE